MKTSPLISIIVPVYNAQNYLKSTIESILSQSYQNIELLLINDGSTDSSRLICEYYAQKDSRVKTINQINSGASAARNTGIECSSAEFLCFVDSDDIITNDYIQRFFDDFAKEEKADIIIQGLVQKWQYSDTLFAMHDGLYNLSKQDGLALFNDIRIIDFSGPYCKLYRKSILDNYHIRFSEKIIYAEDLDFLLRYLLNSQIVITSSAHNYNYIMHNGSVSCKIYDFDKELDGLCQLLSSFNAITKKFNSPALIENRNESINAYIWRVIYSNYYHKYLRGTRIGNFRRLDNDIIYFFKKNYTSTTLFTRVVKLLLGKRFFRILDSILFIRLSLIPHKA